MAKLNETVVFVEYLGDEPTAIRTKKTGDKTPIKKGQKVLMPILMAINLARASKRFAIVSAKEETKKTVKEETNTIK